MAALFLARTGDSAFAEAALDEATAEFALQGFGEAAVLDLPGWRLLHYGYVQGGPETLLVRGEDFAAVAGTLTFAGKMGRGALDALLDGLDPLAPDWSRLGGQFVLAIRKHGRTFLLTDYFAAFELFRDGENRLFSTAFLAAAKALPRLRFDPQGLYEFAFNIVPLGDDTVLADVKTLGPDTALELMPDGVVEHSLAKPLPASTDDRSIEARLAGAARPLVENVAAHAAQFGDRIFAPLTGGLDSRLLLAALRAAGSRPNLYVYGPKGSDEVEIALAIGKAEGLAVEHIDKWAAAEALPPGAFADRVAANFHAFDGLPTYGNIFDDGANLRARARRHAGGALAASGGCGEIFRNFFFLPDRPMRAATVASTFYARFDPRDATALFDPRRFLDRIARKIGAAVGEDDPHRPIPRAAVEQIYPRVRCRALFGREISLEARQSPYLMPFLDQRLVAEAMTLPLLLKNAGRFEAMLIDHLDPALARHMSAYGHDFAGPPNLSHRFDEWSTRARPAWLRRASYAIQRRLKPRMADEHGGLLGPGYMGRAIDLDFPHMRHFFHVDRITDAGLWRRIACLEYLAERLGSRLRA